MMIPCSWHNLGCPKSFKKQSKSITTHQIYCKHNPYKSIVASTAVDNVVEEHHTISPALSSVPSDIVDNHGTPEVEMNDNSESSNNNSSTDSVSTIDQDEQSQIYLAGFLVLLGKYLETISSSRHTVQKKKKRNAESAQAC